MQKEYCKLSENGRSEAANKMQKEYWLFKLEDDEKKLAEKKCQLKALKEDIRNENSKLKLLMKYI